jgi:ACR3 family arsenite efflux pump ArsB
MMIGIQVNEITKAATLVRPIGLSVLLNFLVSPLVGAGIAALVFSAYPDFAVAIILLSVTPCAGMVVGWAGMAKGNVALALVIVSFSLVLSIFTIPASMAFLAGSVVQIDAAAMFKGTAFIILLPLAAGDLSRRMMIKYLGKDRFATGVKPLLAPTSMLGMFLIIFISAAMGADRVAANLSALLYIVPALIIFYLVQFYLAGWLARQFKLAQADTIAMTYGVSGKNISLAIGIASQFFSPLTVLMLAINPLIQMPAMGMYLKRIQRNNSGDKK